jgi:hypothetical protein
MSSFIVLEPLIVVISNLDNFKAIVALSLLNISSSFFEKAAFNFCLCKVTTTYKLPNLFCAKAMASGAVFLKE